MKKHTAKTEKFGTAPTMRAAASRLNLRYETVQAAKNSGCAAFRVNGNVNCDELTEWLKENPEVVEVFEAIPDAEREEALKLQAERRTKEVVYHRALNNIAPVDQSKRVMFAYSRLITPKLKNLVTQLAFEHSIPEEEIAKYVNPIVTSITPENIEAMVREIERNSK